MGGLCALRRARVATQPPTWARRARCSCRPRPRRRCLPLYCVCARLAGGPAAPGRAPGQHGAVGRGRCQGGGGVRAGAAPGLCAHFVRVLGHLFGHLLGHPFRAPFARLLMCPSEKDGRRAAARGAPLDTCPPRAPATAPSPAPLCHCRCRAGWPARVRTARSCGWSRRDWWPRASSPTSEPAAACSTRRRFAAQHADRAVCPGDAPAPVSALGLNCAARPRPAGSWRSWWRRSARSTCPPRPTPGPPPLARPDSGLTGRAPVPRPHDTRPQHPPPLHLLISAA